MYRYFIHTFLWNLSHFMLYRTLSENMTVIKLNNQNLSNKSKLVLFVLKDNFYTPKIYVLSVNSS